MKYEEATRLATAEKIKTQIDSDLEGAISWPWFETGLKRQPQVRLGWMPTACWYSVSIDAYRIVWRVEVFLKREMIELNCETMIPNKAAQFGHYNHEHVARTLVTMLRSLVQIELIRRRGRSRYWLYRRMRRRH